MPRAYIGGIVENIGGRRIAIGGVADHVHLLVDLPPTVALSDFVRAIKSKFAWQNGYSAFSVSRSGVDSVVRYIGNQEEHHRKVNYQDEALFPTAHAVGYVDFAAPRL